MSPVWRFGFPVRALKVELNYLCLTTPTMTSLPPNNCFHKCFRQGMSLSAKDALNTLATLNKLNWLILIISIRQTVQWVCRPYNNLLTCATQTVDTALRNAIDGAKFQSAEIRRNTWLHSHFQNIIAWQASKFFRDAASFSPLPRDHLPMMLFFFFCGNGNGSKLEELFLGGDRLKILPLTWTPPKP